MRVDFFEPVTGPIFYIESEVKNRRDRTILIETRFRDGAGTLLLLALTTLREQRRT
jgi:acyl-coenzyme A thioesterase PaaI-like protein